MKKTTFIKPRYVTLVEILIVLAIVISLSGIFGISIYRAKKEQQFKSEVELIVNQLRFAQELMLIFRGDVILKLTKVNDHQAALQLEFEVKLPAPWKDELSKKTHILNTIKGFHFQDQNPLASDDSKDELKMYFLSNGAFMSRGLIRLTDTQNEQQASMARYIYLSGYPKAITSSMTPPAEETRDEGSRLTQRIKEEIHV